MGVQSLAPASAPSVTSLGLLCTSVSRASSFELRSGANLTLQPASRFLRALLPLRKAGT